MHPLLLHIKTDDAEGYAFWCPACAQIDEKHGLHVFTIKDPGGDPDKKWSFDGNASFEPSLTYKSAPYCHLHLTGGKLRYYSDSTALAGQTVDMVPIPPGRHEERA